jgi:hypothetical protein
MIGRNKFKELRASFFAPRGFGTFAPKSTKEKKKIIS